jgi:hypothetical protein
MGMAKKRHPAEKMFLRMIKKFEPDQITDAVEKGVDLAKIIREEAPDEIIIFKQLARSWFRDNPDYRKKMKEENDERVAEQMVKALAKEAPELAERLTMGPPILEASSLGLTATAVNSPIGQAQLEQEQEDPGLKYPEAGIDWVRMNYVNLRRLLLGR